MMAMIFKMRSRPVVMTAAKFLILFVAFCVISIRSNASDFLIFQNGNLIGLYDVQTDTEYTLSDSANGKLMGYAIDNKRMYYYVQKENLIDTFVYSIDNLSVSLLIHSSILSQDTVDFGYHFNGFILKELNHCVVLCKNKTPIWSVGNRNVSCPDCLLNEASSSTFKYFNPSISPDHKYIVYSDYRATFLYSWNKIFLIQLDNGIRSILTDGKDPKCSPNSHFMLYQSVHSKKYYIMNILNKQKINRSYDIAYWVHS